MLKQDMLELFEVSYVRLNSAFYNFKTKRSKSVPIVQAFHLYSYWDFLMF